MGKYETCFSSEMRTVTGSGGSTTTTCVPAGTSAPAAAVARGGGTLASTSVGSLASVCTMAMLNGMDDDIAESAKASVSMEKSKQRFADDITDNKLSPKVYCGQAVIAKSLVHSLEDVNSGMEYARSFCHAYSAKPDNPRPWGSLQEIRNLGSSISDNCIVRYFFIMHSNAYI